MTTAVAVTGIGALSPVGLGTEEHWAATLAGRHGLAPISRFDASGYPATLAGEIRDFAVGEHLADRLLPQTDRMTQFALAASDRALADAGVDPVDAEEPVLDRGVITASASGGFEYGQRELTKLWTSGPRQVSAYMSFAWFYAVNSGQISIRHGYGGANAVIVADRAGGLEAVAAARRRVRSGLSFALTGGVDAALCPFGLVSMLAAENLSTSDDPSTGYRPFDADASGHVPGEGGAILAIEPAARARARGATSYGEIAGHGSSFDPRPGSGRPPTLRRAVDAALADAGIGPDRIALVVADGAADPELDAAEARVLAEVFGPGGVPVTVPKTATGNLYSGSGALDLVDAMLALRDGLAPPTLHTTPDPRLEIDLVTERPRPLRGDAALVLARGHGGFNAATVVRAPD